MQKFPVGICTKASIMNLPFMTNKSTEPADHALDKYLERSQKPLNIFAFSAIFAYKLDLVQYFSTTSTKEIFSNIIKDAISHNFQPIYAFANEHGLEFILAISTFMWWNQLNGAVKNEKNLLIRTYSDMKVKKLIGSVIGHSSIQFVGASMTITFMILAFCIDNIALYACIVIILNIHDIWGNNKIIINLADDFWKDRFAPPVNDEYRQYAIDREKIIESYWIGNPQIERICLFAVAAALTIALGISDKITGIQVPKIVPYTVMIAAIFANKITMLHWRKKRDEALYEIDLKESKARGLFID